VAKSQDDFRPSDADEALRDPEFTTDDAAQRSRSDTSGSDPSQRLRQLEGELQQTQDRLLRSQAELENFRRRMQREMQDERRFANQMVLVDLLPVIDNMERAINASEQTPECAGLLQGFQMLHQLFLSTLEKHGCRRVPAEGVNFDPTLHEAVMQTPSEEHPTGAIVQVVQNGYQLQDRVIRPAQVIVSSGPATVE
jgi:molecular chaperone GrpE